jgi:hypothetical protein
MDSSRTELPLVELVITNVKPVPDNLISVISVSTIPEKIYPNVLVLIIISMFLIKEPVINALTNVLLASLIVLIVSFVPMLLEKMLLYVTVKTGYGTILL